MADLIEREKIIEALVNKNCEGCIDAHTKECKTCDVWDDIRIIKQIPKAK